jgi:hypothetical protein
MVSVESFEKTYSNMPIFSDFMGVADESNFHDVPEEWLVVVTDIKGSTKAIEEGRYKEVNILEASSIIAVLNCVKNVEIPFSFGGDGASFIIPESLRKCVEKALNSTKRMAKARFNLELRLGVVPVKDIVKGGYSMRIAKMQFSPWGTLAMFSGGGLTYAEKLIKDPETSSTYEIQPEKGSPPHEDFELFEGLECRWEPVLSRKGETLSLMVLANEDSEKNKGETYSKFIEELRKIYGAQKDYCPITPSQLKVAIDPKLLVPETKVRTFNKIFFTRLTYPFFLRLTCLLGRAIIKFGLKWVGLIARFISINRLKIQIFKSLTTHLE